MRYRLHEIDRHDVVATTVAADRDEALEWFSEKLRLMLTFEGDPGSADYLLDEWPRARPSRHTRQSPPFRFFSSEQLPRILRHHKALDVVRPVLKSHRFSWASSPKWPPAVNCVFSSAALICWV
jgi:hypothetical protein